MLVCKTFHQKDRSKNEVFGDPAGTCLYTTSHQRQCNIMTFVQRRINVDATSWQYIDVDWRCISLLYKVRRIGEFLVSLICHNNSPKETICMKCQSLFSGTNKKNISKCHLLKILLSIKWVVTDVCMATCVIYRMLFFPWCDVFL